MIKLQLLSLKDMDIFRDKTVVLYSYESNPIRLFFVLKELDVSVKIACVKRFKPKYYLLRLIGLRVVKEEKFFSILSSCDNIMVQSVANEPEQIKAINILTKKLKAQCSPFLSGEIMNSFSHMGDIAGLHNFCKYTLENLMYIFRCQKTTTREWRRFKRERNINAIVICSPPKTADFTLNYTFDEINRNFRECDSLSKKVHYINLSHNPSLLKKCKKSKKPLKIIMGLREPISQNLSNVYQALSVAPRLSDWALAEIHVAPNQRRSDVLSRYEKFVSEHLDDVQEWFNVRIRIYLCHNQDVKKCCLVEGLFNFLFRCFRTMQSISWHTPSIKRKGTPS